MGEPDVVGPAVAEAPELPQEYGKEPAEVSTLPLLSPQLQLQLLRAKRRRPASPAAISLIPFLSGCRIDAGDGGGSANHSADVYRLDNYLSRSKLYSPLIVDGGVRVCREGAPPRFAFPGGVGKAKATAALMVDGGVRV